ncbi:DUF6192 family protein [Streptomyces asoensis]|uniref:DUF6192 family protein n=1 Tax=Streptomyces asoensis TaxID=249586 RepID=UPI003558DB20
MQPSPSSSAYPARIRCSTGPIRLTPPVCDPPGAVFMLHSHLRHYPPSLPACMHHVARRRNRISSSKSAPPTGRGGQVTASLPSRSETASALPAADRVRVVQGLTRGDEVGSHATSELPRRPRAGVHMTQTRAVTRKAKAATMMATRT